MVATTLPSASSRAASAGPMRTSVTCFATSSITVCRWKRWPATDDDAREVVLVDERDARLRARVPGDETDEHRDDDRIRDERAEQERRAEEDAQVLAQQQERGGHPNTSSTVSATTRPSCSTIVRPRVLDLLEVLRREAHRASFGAQRVRDLPHAPPLAGVERRRRLVEQEDARLAEQRDGDVQPLAVADRQLARRPCRRRAARSARASARAARDRLANALEAREELEVLARATDARSARAAAAPSRHARASRPCPGSPRSRPRGSRGASTSPRRSARRARPSRPARARDRSARAPRRRRSGARRCSARSSGCVTAGRRVGAASRAERSSTSTAIGAAAFQLLQLDAARRRTPTRRAPAASSGSATRMPGKP